MFITVLSHEMTVRALTSVQVKPSQADHGRRARPQVDLIFRGAAPYLGRLWLCQGADGLSNVEAIRN